MQGLVDTASQTKDHFPFTDMPNDEEIDAATNANHDVDWNAVAPEKFPKGATLANHQLPGPLA